MFKTQGAIFLFGERKVFEKLNDIIRNSGREIYLVGGCLRDMLLRRNLSDIDIAVQDLTLELAESVARELGGTLVILEKKQVLYRVVIKEAEDILQIDMEDMGLQGIIANLKNRDFTINALALPLSSYCNREQWQEEIIDPLGGTADLDARVIKACTPDSINNDPLRALRAFRFSGKLGFEITGDTLKLITGMTRSIKECAGERVWEELSQILSLGNTSSILRVMDGKTNLLEELFPEIIPLKGMEQGGHHVDHVWEHLCKTLDQGERLLNQELSDEINALIGEYLQEPLTKNRTRLPVIKLAMLFHDVGKQFCRKKKSENSYSFIGHDALGVDTASQIAKRLRFSNAEKMLFTLLVKEHMRPLFLYKVEDITPRALRKFFTKTDKDTLGILLLSLSDVYSTRKASGKMREGEAYKEFIYDLMEKYAEEGERYLSPPQLLNGHEICKILGIPPSYRVGKILESLTDAQVQGKINSREEASKFIKNTYK